MTSIDPNQMYCIRFHLLIQCHPCPTDLLYSTKSKIYFAMSLSNTGNPFFSFFLYLIILHLLLSCFFSSSSIFCSSTFFLFFSSLPYLILFFNIIFFLFLLLHHPFLHILFILFCVLTHIIVYSLKRIQRKIMNAMPESNPHAIVCSSCLRCAFSVLG
jgi:hypothetical protein